MLTGLDTLPQGPPDKKKEEKEKARMLTYADAC
jgi:hypothetical protein